MPLYDRPSFFLGLAQAFNGSPHAVGQVIQPAPAGEQVDLVLGLKGLLANPALRLDRPRGIERLIGRDEVCAACLNALQQGRTIGLSRCSASIGFSFFCRARRSFSSAMFCNWWMRSRVTPNFRPTSSSVRQ